MGYPLVARGVHTDTTTDLEEENLPLVLLVMTFPRSNNSEFTPGTPVGGPSPRVPGVKRRGCKWGYALRDKIGWRRNHSSPGPAPPASRAAGYSSSWRRQPLSTKRGTYSAGTKRRSSGLDTAW